VTDRGVENNNLEFEGEAIAGQVEEERTSDSICEKNK
jgi:hypothetical protein